MNRYVLILLTVLAILGCSSCHKNSDIPNTIDPTRTVLIYAVASNNLSTYLEKDIAEMIEAAPNVESLGENVRVLLYSVASKSASVATLDELLQNADGSWSFQTLKTYDRDTFSTDPERMSQVYADVREISPTDCYSLIFWSHGTGWLPNFSTHEVPAVQRSFGWDTYQDVTDKCDIIELADAIPAGMFDYIWFDVCYMMSIETAYQLRNKCDYIAGYPTEDWSPGMNYDSTLPMLASVSPDLIGTAKSFFDYYNSANMAVTVSVIDTNGLDNLAAVCSEIYACGKRPDSAIGLQDYGRSPYRGLYDFGQFSRAYLSSLDENDENADNAALLQAFSNALDDVLLYGGCTSKDFDGKNAFDPDIYSGMSCHFPYTFTSEQEAYYQSLDWTKATNP